MYDRCFFLPQGWVVQETNPPPMRIGGGLKILLDGLLKEEIL